MAFNNGFSGKTEALPYAVRVLERKSYLVPGFTVNPGLSVSATGETIQYFVPNMTSTSIGNLGDKVDFKVSGVTAKTVAITKASQIKAVIPKCNADLVPVSVVGEHVVRETIKSSNDINEDYITKLEAAAEAETLTYDATKPFKFLNDLRAKFVTANKDYNLKPTAVFVSPTIYSDLLTANLLIFKDGMPFGSFSDMMVIECPDLVSKAVMLNAVAMYGAENIRSLIVQDGTATGYIGSTLVAGEIGFVNGATDLDFDDSVDSTDKFEGKLILKVA